MYNRFLVAISKLYSASSAATTTGTRTKEFIVAWVQSSIVGVICKIFATEKIAEGLVSSPGSVLRHHVPCVSMLVHLFSIVIIDTYQTDPLLRM
jgi:hypothetical protein